MDIAYLSEIDPTWVDSSLTTILNLETILFVNPIAQGRELQPSQLARAIHMPLDILFTSAGSQGSMYPFSGWVSNESSLLQSSLLLVQRAHGVQASPAGTNYGNHQEGLTGLL
ncbi:TraU family protein [Klebsiella pneumoniae]